jgi:hypothetical protein
MASISDPVPLPQVVVLPRRQPHRPAPSSVIRCSGRRWPRPRTRQPYTLSQLRHQKHRVGTDPVDIIIVQQAITLRDTTPGLTAIGARPKF